jgi:hypothetical protein
VRKSKELWTEKIPWKYLNASLFCLRAEDEIVVQGPDGVEQWAVAEVEEAPGFQVRCYLQDGFLGE